MHDHNVRRWKRDCFFNEVEIRRGIVWKKIPKNNFEKDVMDLIEANHQINIISENSSASGNTLFKKDLNAKSLAMLWESCSSCAK